MNESRRHRIVAIAVALFAMALHLRTLRSGFVNWDDDRFITNNPLFATGGWDYVRDAFTRVQFEAYQPLHLLSYLPDRWFWAHWAAGFHALNLLVFGLVVFLVFCLASRHAGPTAAAAASLLFAAHPLCVEPVGWITARKDLLAAALFIGVLLLEDRRDVDETRSSPAGLALFVAALLTKTSALCLPLVLLVWLVWMKETTWRTAARRALPYALLGIIPAIAVVRIWHQHQMIPERPVSPPIDVLATLATYARRTIWPTDLAAMYPVEMPASTLSAALAGICLTAVVLSWRRLPAAARFGVAGFLTALLPVANIVPLAVRFADRYAFLALATLVPAVAVGIQALFRVGKAFRAVSLCALALVVVFFASITVPLASTWKDSRSLWAHAAAAHPESFATRLKYGGTLLDLGDLGTVTRDEFHAAISLKPLHSYGYAGLLFLYARRAEEQGHLAPGTHRQWQAAFEKAQYRSSTFDAFIASVPRAACPACSDTLLLMRLRRWPKSDQVLLQAARAALQQGAPDAAAVFLDVAVDHDAPEWRDLAATGLHSTNP